MSHPSGEEGDFDVFVTKMSLYVSKLCFTCFFYLVGFFHIMESLSIQLQQKPLYIDIDQEHQELQKLKPSCTKGCVILDLNPTRAIDLERFVVQRIFLLTFVEKTTCLLTLAEKEEVEEKHTGKHS